MATLTETDFTRVSTEAGEEFVDSYYTALNGTRHTINSFYVPPLAGAPGRSLPHISYNGEILNDGAALQQRFEQQMPWSHYEAQSVNVHVMNPSAAPPAGTTKKDAERTMSLVVQVSGYVRLGERNKGPQRGFAESFVLVPNREEVGAKGTGKQDVGRKWLVQSQNFRFVV